MVNKFNFLVSFFLAALTLTAPQLSEASKQELDDPYDPIMHSSSVGQIAVGEVSASKVSQLEKICHLC